MQKLFTLIIFVLLVHTSGADNTPILTSLTNSVLYEEDIVGLQITSSTSRGYDVNRRSLYNPGYYQEATVEGIRLFVSYSEFPSAKQAEQAAEFHVHDVASVFYKGIWDNASLKNIGDVSWYSVDGWSVGLLVLSVNTCVLISCHDGDAINRKRVCEQIALKIVEKIEQNTKKKLSVKTTYIIESNVPQTNALNTIIETQTLSPDDTPSLTISTDEDITVISPKSYNLIWLYLGIGTLLMCVFTCFFRKKYKQTNL